MTTLFTGKMTVAMTWRCTNMLGLGKAAARVSDFALGTEFSDQYADQPEVEEVQSSKPEAPITITAKQMGIVKPFVKDPQRDFNHLVELFGVIGESQKYIKCSCPECGYEEEGLHSSFSSTAMDAEVVCSSCDYEDEFAEFYDETITRLSTSRTPSEDEIRATMGRSIELETALDYYALLAGVSKKVPLDNVDHINAGYDEDEGRWLIHCGERCKERNCQCSNYAMNLMFGKVKSLQAVNAAASSNDDEDFDDE